LDPLAQLDALIAAATPAERGSIVVALAARLASLGAAGMVPATQPEGTDRNLDVEEAAARLGMSKGWVYRHGHELPFAVRISRRLLFSERGLEAFLARRRT
jgi:predicted DNA-binding transcriptional regulator AlpA